MKVLMFGWEFPPHILGGLGTASYGLTKGMSQQEAVSYTHLDVYKRQLKRNVLMCVVWGRLSINLLSGRYRTGDINIGVL